MAMNVSGGAGNFPKFNNLKAGNQIQPKTGPGPQESPSVQQDPSESVQIGAQPVANTGVDAVSTGQQKAEAAPVLNIAPATSSIPSQIGGALIAGISGNTPTAKASFPGLSLNGLGSTSLETIGGGRIASLNAMNPKSPTKMPTTSIGLLNGLDSQQFVTTSGRVITG